MAMLLSFFLFSTYFIVLRIKMTIKSIEYFDMLKYFHIIISL